MTNNFLTKSADIRLQITKARIRLIVASGVTRGKSRAQRFRINMKRAVRVSLFKSEKEVDFEASDIAENALLRD